MALTEIIYTSLSQVNLDSSVVQEILASSEKNNTAISVTGLLLFDGERYIQILEGQAADVDRLFDVICEDDRHHSLELIHKGGIAGRSFETWRMAYEALPKGLLENLAENMAVYSLESEDRSHAIGESFGGKLNSMFIDAIAAE